MWIVRPEFQSVHHRGGQKVNVNPANAPAMQVAALNEGHNLPMGNHSGLKHVFIVGQELLAPATVSDQQFPVDQIVSGHIIEIEQPGQFGHEWRAATQGSNPDRRVNQHH
jgi:hypothetical protein